MYSSSCVEARGNPDKTAQLNKLGAYTRISWTDLAGVPAANARLLARYVPDMAWNRGPPFQEAYLNQ